MHTFNLAQAMDRVSDIPFRESELAKRLKHIPPLSPDGPWLCGGAIRRMLTGREHGDADLDLFFPDPLIWANYQARMIRDNGFGTNRENLFQASMMRYEPTVIDVDDTVVSAVFETSPRIHVQLCKFYSPTPEEQIARFDFTCCQFAFDGEHVIAGDHAMQDALNGHLVLNNFSRPKSVLHHMDKLEKQGFTDPSGCIRKMLEPLAAASTEFEDWES